MELPETEVAGTALRRDDHECGLLNTGLCPRNIQSKRIANFFSF